MRCRRNWSATGSVSQSKRPYELRRHPEAARLTWLAAFAHLRGRTLIDDLVDLLIETIHRIGARAERKVDRELLDNIKRVTGKQNLLFEVADATLEKPDGIVREVVFPVVYSALDRCSRRSFPDRWQPSPFQRRVGFRSARFEACSAFTRVVACVVAEPPEAALCHRSASDDVVTSTIRSDCYRLERQLPGRIRTR